MNCIGELLEIGRPPAYKTKTEQYNLEEGEPWYQKAQKKIMCFKWESNLRPSDEVKFGCSNHWATGDSTSSRARMPIPAHAGTHFSPWVQVSPR